MPDLTAALSESVIEPAEPMIDVIAFLSSNQTKEQIRQLRLVNEKLSQATTDAEERIAAAEAARTAIELLQVALQPLNLSPLVRRVADFAIHTVVEELGAIVLKDL